MSWSRTYSSAEQLEKDSALPDNASKKSFETAKAAAKTLLDSGIIPILDIDPNHEKNPDNLNESSEPISTQARVRVSIGGHDGQNPSIYVSVSGV